MFGVVVLLWQARWLACRGQQLPRRDTSSRLAATRVSWGIHATLHAQFTVQPHYHTSLHSIARPLPRFVLSLPAVLSPSPPFTAAPRQVHDGARSCKSIRPSLFSPPLPSSHGPPPPPDFAWSTVSLAYRSAHARFCRVRPNPHSRDLDLPTAHAAPFAAREARQLRLHIPPEEPHRVLRLP